MAEYLRKIVGIKIPEFRIDKRNTALLIIDMMDKRPQIFIDKIKKLQVKFREKGMEVLHVKSHPLTADGRDLSLPDKGIRGIDILAGARGLRPPYIYAPREIIEELRPRGDELVFTKTTSSVFNSTNIDYVLRNKGIECLVMTGTSTARCVGTSLIDAREKGYNIILVEDASFGPGVDTQEHWIWRFSDVYAKIMRTDQVLEIISGL